MLEHEKIKALRREIAIPLAQAIKLLKKNDGDVAACVNEFHANNILKISEIAECDIEEASKNYKLFKYDIVKAIDRINDKQVIISTREVDIPRNEIGYILWPEKKDGGGYKTTKRNDAFIPTADFDYIIEDFRSVFPFKNPHHHRVDDHFDICGFNHFDKAICELIIHRLKRKIIEEKKVFNFVQEVIDWLEDKLTYGEVMVVYGNL